MWASRLRRDGGAAFAGVPRRLLRNAGQPPDAAAKRGAKPKPEAAPAPLASSSAVSARASPRVSSSSRRASTPPAKRGKRDEPLVISDESGDDCSADSLELASLFGPAIPCPGDGGVVLPRARSRKDLPRRPAPATPRGSSAHAISAVGDKAQALLEYETDVRARSSTDSHAALLAKWIEFHEAWFGSSTPPWPLTATKVRAVMAMFKRGCYASAMNYLSAARCRSRDLGFVENPLVEHEARRAKRACLRGFGKAKQTRALPVHRFRELPPGEAPWCRGGPIGPRDVLTVGCWFLAREIELANAQIRDVFFNQSTCEVHFELPCSKTDLRAVGVFRVHGCLCSSGSDPEAHCPFHALLAQHARAVASAKTHALESPSAPLFPNSEGTIVSKAAMQATITEGARLLGLPTVGPAGEALFTGHACRRSGAEHFTACGIEVYVTQLFGRWGGQTILKYCREAPLVNSRRLAKRTMGPTGPEWSRPSQSYVPGQAAEAGELRASAHTLEAASKGARGAEVEELRKGLAELREALRLLECKSALPGDPPAGLIASCVTNLMSNVTHAVLVGSTRVPNQLWRTRCGWRFGLAPFALGDTGSAKPCASCFGDDG